MTSTRMPSDSILDSTNAFLDTGFDSSQAAVPDSLSFRMASWPKMMAPMNTASPAGLKNMSMPASAISFWVMTNPPPAILSCTAGSMELASSVCAAVLLTSEGTRYITAATSEFRMSSHRMSCIASDLRFHHRAFSFRGMFRKLAVQP
jgi:hypothetical protein